MHKASLKATDRAASNSSHQDSTVHSVVRNGLGSPEWSNHRLVLQPSLKINAPGDRFEQEAERVANQVMRMPAPDLQRATCSCGKPAGPDGMCQACQEKQLSIQRVAAGKAGQRAAPPIVDQVVQQPGRPLDGTTRNFMQSRFGQDFGEVRVHADAQAAASANAVHAHAYTVGQNVVFGPGTFSPTTKTGQRLLAHELTHVLQQRDTSDYSIQRVPLESLDLDTSTRGLHERLADEFAAETGHQSQPGVQYTEEYQQWLQEKSDKYKFQPPKVTRQNPLDRVQNGRITSHTFLMINGTKFLPGGTIGTLSEQYRNAITPPSIVFTPSGADVNCRFGDEFQIQSSAEIVVHSAPGRNGWQKTMNPNDVLQPADQPRCAGQASVPVTLRGNPSDADYAKIIEDGEREHARALESLHDKHFVPYYHFVRSLRASGANETECGASLRKQVGKRDTQAALGFIFGDLAETRRFDDPTLGTHHSRITPTIDPDCKAITLTAGQIRTQRPGLDPGNVRTIAPTTTRVDPTKLVVDGRNLNEETRTIRSFNSAENARLALQLFQHHGITEMLRLGTFEFLLAGGHAPRGSIAGPNERKIDPDFYQVTFGVPNPTDWSIIEVVGDTPLLIHDFDANRDQAYSAVALMRQHGFNREVWLGPAHSPELKFFRKD